MTGHQRDRTWRRTVRRLRWRARHGTAVTRWSAGLAVAATVGHAAVPTWWPVPLALGVLWVLALTIGRRTVMGAVRRGWWTPDPDTRRALRKRQQATEAAGTLGLGGTLVALVWATGWTAWTLGAWLAATSAVGAVWVWRRRIRRRDAAARRREREAAEAEARNAARATLSRAQRAYRAAAVTAARIERDGLGIGRLLAVADDHGLSYGEARAVLADAVEDGDLVRRRDGWHGSRWCSPWHSSEASPEPQGGRRLWAVGDE